MWFPHVVDTQSGGHPASKSSMGTMMIIVMHPFSQRLLPFLVGPVQAGIGPLAQQGLDEPFSLTVGLGPVRPGNLMTRAEPLQDAPDGQRAEVGRRAICHHALDPDSMLREEGRGVEQEARCGESPTIGEELYERHPRGIVDSDVEHIVTGSGVPRGDVPSERPMATALRNPPQRLHVDVEQLTGMVPYVPHRHARGGIQVAQPGEALAAEHRVDRRAGLAHEGTEPMRPPTQAEPQCPDLLRLFLWSRPRRDAGARGALLKASWPFQPPAMEPLIGRGARDAQRRGSLAYRPTHVHDSLHEQQPSQGCEFGILMGHSRLQKRCGIAFSHIHSRRQLNVNNLSGNYS